MTSHADAVARHAEDRRGPEQPLVRGDKPLARNGHRERTCAPTGSSRRLLYVKDLKRMLDGLGDDTIYALVGSGEIPARKVGGKWVTTPEAVDGWLSGISNSESRRDDGQGLRVVR